MKDIYKQSDSVISIGDLHIEENRIRDLSDSEVQNIVGGESSSSSSSASSYDDGKNTYTYSYQNNNDVVTESEGYFPSKYRSFF